MSFNSPVILSFTAICFVTLLLGYLTRNATTNLLFSVYRSPFLSPLTYIRLVGHVFGHAGWDHFIGNIMLLLVVGPLLEEKYGSPNILGASGVVFAFILLASLTSIKSGSIPLTFILVAVIYMGQQIYEGIFLQDNVANLTHIFGGIVGAGLGYVMNKKKMNRY